MNITTYITDLVAERKEDGEESLEVWVGINIWKQLCNEMQTNFVEHIMGVPVALHPKLPKGSINVVTPLLPCSTKSVRSECSKCGYLSYINGYCHECGLFRAGDEDEAPDFRDLVELISSQDEALEYGFGLLED